MPAFVQRNYITDANAVCLVGYFLVGGLEFQASSRILMLQISNGNYVDQRGWSRGWRALIKMLWISAVRLNWARNNPMPPLLRHFFVVQSGEKYKQPLRFYYFFFFFFFNRVKRCHWSADGVQVLEWGQKISSGKKCLCLVCCSHTVLDRSWAKKKIKILKLYQGQKRLLHCDGLISNV